MRRTEFKMQDLAFRIRMCRKWEAVCSISEGWRPWPREGRSSYETINEDLGEFLIEQ
jgi:hypothetical protein